MVATRKRHSPEQVVRKLVTADRLLAEGMDTAAVCRELGISQATYHRWRNQFGGLKADDAKRLKKLERENAKLKRLLADAELEKIALKEIGEGKLLGPERRRAAVRHLQQELGVSERFACRVTGQPRATQRHQPAATTTDPDAALRAWLRSYAKEHPGRGFRPAYRDAVVEGWVVNHKKVQRLWREEGLRVAQSRRGERQASSISPSGMTADRPNRIWAAVFLSGATIDGRPIKIMSIVDEHTRECLGGLIVRSITGEGLIAVLERLAASRGTYPDVVRCHNGPELACAAMSEWATEHAGLHFIPPSEPRRNNYVEWFNSRIRDECLNINSFWSLNQARIAINDWKHDYNHRRRHAVLGHLPPARYAAACKHR
ncbi:MULTISPECIES: IS3 family transposase [Mycobacterium]|uniref:IS3 family transposase n=1 Tax=Mycobacterium TaxID=1763 RepID=UPI0013DE6B69|nr:MULTISPECIES: IS3 family transposase [Mycobacterium]MDC8972967.1 IS3 family transposase [Mycobacterium marinum]QQW37245.1 IS3 family transposase [Mycobacterium marinum]